jgi:hypothetical protein
MQLHAGMVTANPRAAGQLWSSIGDHPQIRNDAWLQLLGREQEFGNRVWNEATVKEYIAEPRAKIPGTKMVFPGIKNPQEAADLWAYLKQFDADGNIKQ